MPEGSEGLPGLGRIACARVNAVNARSHQILQDKGGKGQEQRREKLFPHPVGQSMLTLRHAVFQMPHRCPVTAYRVLWTDGAKFSILTTISYRESADSLPACVRIMSALGAEVAG